MISITDKKIYFPKSFNEQMAWIDEEIEHIIKYNDKYNIKENIQEKGRATYGEQGYTHVINKLFEIVKSDPKNKAILHEVCKAEQELIAYLYDEPGHGLKNRYMLTGILTYNHILQNWKRTLYITF